MACRPGLATLALAALMILPPGCVRPGASSLDVTGQIRAVTIEAGSRVGGRVAEVPVHEGDRVKQGDVLVRLEDTEAKAALTAAQGRLAQAQAVLAKLETGARPEEIRQAEAAANRADQQYRLAVKGFRSQEVRGAAAALDGARAQRDEARAEFQRIEKLRASEAASVQHYDQARHALEAAEAQCKVAQEKLGIAVEGARAEDIAMAKAGADQAAAALDMLRNGARKEDLDAARAARDTAAADVARAQVAVDEMRIIAPRDGVAESLDLHPGDLIKPGASVRIADPEDLEVIVYVSAPLLGRLQVGQKLPLSADAYATEVFEGTIVRLATEGEYTPRNLQTREERVQQVFGVKVKLNSNGGKLKAGMTIAAHLPGAERTARAEVADETWSAVASAGVARQSFAGKCVPKYSSCHSPQIHSEAYTAQSWAVGSAHSGERARPKMAAALERAFPRKSLRQARLVASRRDAPMLAQDEVLGPPPRQKESRQGRLKHRCLPAMTRCGLETRVGDLFAAQGTA